MEWTQRASKEGNLVCLVRIRQIENKFFNFSALQFLPGTDKVELKVETI